MDLFTPHQLLLAIKKTGIRKDNFFLRTFYREMHTFGTEKVDLDLIPNRPKIAPFCSPLVNGQVDRNQSFQATSFKPAYVKSKHAVTTNNSIKRRPGESHSGTMSKAERLNACVMQNMEQENEALDMREEWLAVQMTVFGRYTVEGPNIEEPYEISSGRSSENYITLVGAESWDQLDKETHDIVEDLEEFAAKADGEVNIYVMDPKTWALLRKFKSFKDALDTRRGSNSEIETTLKDLGKSVSFKGHLGDVEIWVVNEEYIDRKGKTQKQMPDYHLVMGHRSARGLRLYGVIQDMDAQEQGMDETDRFAKDWKEGNDPAVRYTKVESAPAPYMTEPDNFVVIKVK